MHLLGKHQINGIEVTKDIAENCVSTFVIYQMFWFLKQGGKIYQRLHASLSTILGCYSRRFSLIK